MDLSRAHLSETLLVACLSACLPRGSKDNNNTIKSMATLPDPFMHAPSAADDELLELARASGLEISPEMFAVVLELLRLDVTPQVRAARRESESKQLRAK